MSFPSTFYQYLQDHTLVEIKGGLSRITFLKIWMVSVDQRVFARSWNKSSRSWFTAFQGEGIGEIKFGDQIISVNGKQLSPDSPLHASIERRYLEKYHQPQNIPYAVGITQPEYRNYTMEFLWPNQ